MATGRIGSQGYMSREMRTSKQGRKHHAEDGGWRYGDMEDGGWRMG